MASKTTLSEDPMPIKREASEGEGSTAEVEEVSKGQISSETISNRVKETASEEAEAVSVDRT
jgi:hypothetical protein